MYPDCTRSARCFLKIHFTVLCFWAIREYKNQYSSTIREISIAQDKGRTWVPLHDAGIWCHDTCKSFHENAGHRIFYLDFKDIYGSLWKKAVNLLWTTSRTECSSHKIAFWRELHKLLLVNALGSKNMKGMSWSVHSISIRRAMTCEDYSWLFYHNKRWNTNCISCCTFDCLS